jgi:hypothetical protein
MRDRVDPFVEMRKPGRTKMNVTRISDRLKRSAVVLSIAGTVFASGAFATDDEQQPPKRGGQTSSASQASPEPEPAVGVSPREKYYGPYSDIGFAKSVPLFGSDWRFSFGGYVKLDVITDFSGTGDEFSFVTPTIPVNGVPPGGAYSNIHARETRFSFEMRNEREGLPFNKAFIEMDFFDEGSTGPRLRHAYFQWGNFLAGQTWTTLSQLDMLPFLLDFAYGDALYGGRQALVRWQQKESDRFSWAVALENWNSEGVENESGVPGVARYTIPLIALRTSYDWAGGNGFVGGSLSQLRWDGTDGVPDDTAPTWAFVTAWRIGLGSEDKSYVGLGGSFGDGQGSNTINLIEGGAANAVLSPDGTLEPMKFWSAQAALHYEFSEAWSTNFNVAWGALDPVPFRNPNTLKASGAGHVNVTYHFAPEFLVGVELMTGRRVNTDGADGRANRLQLSAMYSF